MQSFASIAPLDTSPREGRAIPSTSVETRSSQPRPEEAKLQDLIPVAMVIVGGCEACGSLQICKDSIASLRQLERMLLPAWTNR